MKILHYNLILIFILILVAKEVKSDEDVPCTNGPNGEPC